MSLIGGKTDERTIAQKPKPPQPVQLDAAELLRRSQQAVIDSRMPVDASTLALVSIAASLQKIAARLK
jgi:hypothetical protein